MSYLQNIQNLLFPKNISDIGNSFNTIKENIKPSNIISKFDKPEDKPLTFEVGEGLGEQQSRIAEQVVRKPSDIKDTSYVGKLRTLMGVSPEIGRTGQSQLWNMSVNNLLKDRPQHQKEVDRITRASVDAGFPFLGVKNIASRKVAPKVFQGFEDLSTSIVEGLKNKTTVSKQFIQDALKRQGVKKGEIDVINNVLSEFKSGKISVDDFANRVKSELLPLESFNQFKGVPGEFRSRSTYESVVLPDELRGNIAHYDERIYTSSIKNNAGDIHFENIDDYFAHVRYEDMADGTTRRVIESQSDLFQKGRLQKEFTEPQARINISKLSNSKPIKSDTEQIKGLKRLQPYKNDWYKRTTREEVKQAGIDGKNKLQFPTGETAMKVEGLGEVDNTRWRTAGNQSVLKPEDLKVGSQINSNGQLDWIVTEVLENGKFKAVTKNVYNSIDTKNISIIKDKLPNGNTKYIINNKQTGEITSFSTRKRAEQYVDNFKNETLETYVETFDISGKIDTNNPIYKFYENDMQKFLNKEFDAKRITDPQGVEWFEVNVNNFKEQPVQAFGKAQIGPMATIGSVSASILGLSALSVRGGDSGTKNNTVIPKNIPNKPLSIEDGYISQDTKLNNVKEQELLINKDNENDIADNIVMAESSNMNEKEMIEYLKAVNPGRLNYTKGNKFQDKGEFGWTVGFTIPTYEGIVKKAEQGDKRYIELLSKLNFDTLEGAKKSSIEYMKFRNINHNSNGEQIGYHYDSIEDLYVNKYNASGDRESARINWLKNE